MPDDYKEYQDRYDSLEEEYDEDWSDEEKRNHYENMKDANERYVNHSDLSSRALVRSLLFIRPGTSRTMQNFDPLKVDHSRELQGREEAREEWGDDADDGHDRRIEVLRERDELLNHGIAHAEGGYEYQSEGMQDMDPDLRRELERENEERWGYNEAVERDEESDGDDRREDELEETSDMDIESDSD